MGFLNLFESCLPRLKTTLREREIEPKNNNVAAQTQTLKLKHFWSLDVRFHLSVQFCLGASHWFDVDKIPFQKRRDVVYTGTSVATFESECNGRGCLFDFTALNHI